MDSLSRIKETAAQWIARRGSEDWSQTDEAELSQWLNASTGNLIAFLRMEAAWQEADRLKVLGAGVSRGVVPTLEDFRASPFFKHVSKQVHAPEVSRIAGTAEPEVSRITETPKPDAFKFKPIGLGIAASVLIAVVVLAWNRSFFTGNVYSTATGVVAAVPLSDGSKVTLNTDSEIRVAVTDKERRVELEQGEAFFEVVRDPARPFTVSAGDQQIVVLGTQFSVRRDHNDIRVIVTEGKVRVEQTHAGLHAPSTQLSAGSVARIQDENVVVQERPLPEAQEYLSWRSGYVVFHETSLADAVAEFNRYNTRKFIIQDPEVAAISISGNFRSTNVDSFARLLEDGFPIVVEQQGDRIVLTKRQPL